jgi:hypothetical protein
MFKTPREEFPSFIKTQVDTAYEKISPEDWANYKLSNPQPRNNNQAIIRRARNLTAVREALDPLGRRGNQLLLPNWFRNR